jgi:ribosomal protein L40E
MFCTKCGTELPDNANLCQKCGKQQQLVSQSKQTTMSESQIKLTQEVDLEREVADLSAAWKKNNPARQEEIEREVARLRTNKKAGPIKEAPRSDGFKLFLKLFFGGAVVWVVLIIADFFYRKDSYYLNPAFYQPSAMKPIKGVLFSMLLCMGAWLIGAIVLAFVFRVRRKNMAIMTRTTALYLLGLFIMLGMYIIYAVIWNVGLTLLAELVIFCCIFVLIILATIGRYSKLTLSRLLIMTLLIFVPVVGGLYFVYCVGKGCMLLNNNQATRSHKDRHAIHDILTDTTCDCSGIPHRLG